MNNNYLSIALGKPTSKILKVLVEKCFIQQKKEILSGFKGLYVLLCALMCLMSSLQMQGQALQWSQFTSPNTATSNQGQTISPRIAPDGSIYTVSRDKIGASVKPIYPTSDFVAFSGFSTNNYLALKKYSPDGKTLIWVRTIAGGSQLPLDLELSPTGEPIILFATIAATPNVVTPDAWQPNPPTISGTGGNALMLVKISSTGSINYGTYIGGLGGSLAFQNQTPLNTASTEAIEVAPDGTVYLAFGVRSNAGQNGVLPTTSNAYQTAIPASTNTVAVMIFNANNTLRYSSYFGNSTYSTDQVLAPNGDYYFEVSGAENLPVPSNAAYGDINETPLSAIIKISSTGQVLAGTYTQPTRNENLFPRGQAQALALKANGNLVAVMLGGSIYEFNPTLTTLVSRNNPFGYAFEGGSIVSDIAIDDFGRLHIVGNSSITVAKPTTSGALQSADVTDQAGHYAIIDCGFDKIAYATQIGDGNTNAGENRVYNITLKGCDAYLAGATNPGLGFPVTPSAYNDLGTATVTGYDITPASKLFIANEGDGFIMKFNYPVQKPSTNVLTTPAVTNFCAGSGILAIDGTKTQFLTPPVLGKADNNPAPTSIHYQWQVKQGAGGTWTDIASSDKEDYTPTSPAVAGQYFYRRLVRQTPFGLGLCVPTCDETDISNEISFTYSLDKTHTTDINEKPYGMCGTNTLTLPVNLAPSADGAFGVYNYKLTPLANLNSVVASGTSASAPSVINISVSAPNMYLLQVTDTRGCVSFDTLTVKALTLNAGDPVKFTCGTSTVKLGAFSVLPEYVNYPTPTFVWSSAAGLDNPNAYNPVFTHGLSLGDSTTKFLTLNGCIVDNIKIKNATVAPLPALPNRFICQGDTVNMGPGLVAQAGVTYEWAPSLGLTSTSIVRPVMTSLSAPLGVNLRTYYLKADNGSCAQIDSQKVTVYRYPNQSFQNKECFSNGCSTTIPLTKTGIGNPPEPGITYDWSVVVLPLTATTGVPTAAEALASVVSPTSSMTDIRFTSPLIGKSANAQYKILYIRRSYNAAASALSPTCERRDTAFLDFCCSGAGFSCSAALGVVPAITCGGPNNLIGPTQYSTGGTYIWSRVDGMPLNNELFDPITKLPIVNGGPHSNQVIANPPGLLAINYNLTLYPEEGNDTCRIDIRVFPSAAGNPSVNYASPQYGCQATPYTMQGPAANPGLTYAWSPAASLNNTTTALPTTTALTSNTTFYVTVSDISTTCAIIDTILIVPTLSDVDAGVAGTYCATSATTVNIGSPAKAGYTYLWSSPTSGVTFAASTNAQTTATIPTGAASPVKLFLKATNTTTTQNCMLTDSVVYTVGGPAGVTMPTVDKICSVAGSTVKIGPANNANYTYNWTTSTGTIVGATNTSVITVSKAAVYNLTITQGGCTKALTATVTNAVDPTVTAGPFTAPCAAPLTLAVTNTATATNAWNYSWSTYDGVVATATDQSSISVYPTVGTTYTLSATHFSGCVKTFPFVIPAPTYAATLPNVLDICEGSASADLPLNTLPSGGTVVWTAIPATGTSYLSSTTANNPTIDMSVIPEGSYTYTATVSYPTGCVSSDTVKVRIGKQVTDIAGDDQIICLTKSTKIGTLSKIGYNYEWSAIPFDSTLLSIYTAQPTVTPKVKTTYKVKYSSASGCTFYDYVTIDPKLTASILVVLSDSICQNSTNTATFDLASTIVTNTGATTTYWINASTTIAAANPVSVEGKYYIKSTSADGLCFTTQPVTIGFYPYVNFLINSSFNCAAHKGTVTISSFATGAKADYSIGATYTGSATYATATAVPSSGIVASNVTVTSTGQKQITVRVFNAQGCYTDKTVVVSSAACCSPITLGPVPLPNGTVGVPYSVQVTATGGSGPYQFQMLPGSTGVLPSGLTINSTTGVVSGTPTTSGSFSVKIIVTDANMCPDTLDPATITIVKPRTPCLAGNTGGQVWKDYNGNGVKEATSETQGLEGVTVTAYDCNGVAVATTTTDDLGQYTFGTTLTFPNKYRFEYSNYPAPYLPTSAGTSNATDVRFVTAAGCLNDNGVNNPVDYCQPNPEVIVPCYGVGAYNGPKSGVSGLVSFPDDAGSANLGPFTASNPITPLDFPTTHTTKVIFGQLGATYGVAYHKATKNIFAAAFMKRHVGFGPGGPGAIYKIKNGSTTASVFATLAAGTDPHPTTAGGDWFHDAASFDNVGKMGLGDIIITDDDKYLYVVNMFDKKLYKLDAVTGATLSSILIPVPTGVPTADARPMGLGKKDGIIYVGLVNSAQTAANASSNRGYIYTYNPVTDAFSASSVFDFGLQYDKGYSAGYCTAGGKIWGKWITTWADINNVAGSPCFAVANAPQPMLSDIDFDENGNMVIGLRDRGGDMLGRKEGNLTTGNTTKFDYNAGGDLLKACSIGTSWNIEGNGGCSQNTWISGITEFYEDDFGASNSHNETALGSIVVLKGTNRVISTHYDPIKVYQEDAFASTAFDQGIRWLNNTTGAYAKAYRLVDDNLASANVSTNTNGKANGLGAMTLLCNPAPLQIGNYAWIDTDKDGTQDPCETALPGVKVALYKDVAGVLTLVASTTTGANGEYYFTGLGAANENWIATSGTDSLLPNTNYKIVFGTDGTTPQFAGGKLTIGSNIYLLTDVNSGEGTTPDQNDSDAAIAAIAGGSFPTIALTTGGAGSVNHTYDAGFRLCLTTTATVTNTSCSGSGYAVTVKSTVYNEANPTGTEILVNKAGCDSTVTITLTFNALPIVNAGADKEVCLGQSVTLTATGGGTYVWSTGAATASINVSPTAITKYYVTVTAANGCIAGDTVIVTPILVNAGPDKALTCVSGAAPTSYNIGIAGAWAIFAQPAGANAQVDANGNVTAMTLPGVYTIRLSVAGVVEICHDDMKITIPASCNKVALGNLIFMDMNNNGKYDQGIDIGIDNVVVQLFRAGDNPATATPVSETLTAAGGKYLFDLLDAGQYFVFVPSTQFITGSPLSNKVSAMPLGGDTGTDDDGDENGQNAFISGGIASGIIDLQVGTEPTGETGEGVYAGTLPDNSVNMTVDFGFRALPTILNSEPCTCFAVDYFLGEAKELYSVFTVTSEPGENWTVVSQTGILQLDSVFKIQLPVGAVLVESPAGSGKYSIPSSVEDNNPYTLTVTNGIDIITYQGACLSRYPDPIVTVIDSTCSNAAPKPLTVTANVAGTWKYYYLNGAGQRVYITQFDPSQFPPNQTVTIKMEFLALDPGQCVTTIAQPVYIKTTGCEKVAIGNLIFMDANDDGKFTSGTDMGINGVVVKLYKAGDNPLSATPVATTTTANGGFYLFDQLAEGQYFVFIPSSEFGPGKPLNNKTSSTPEGGGDVPTDDNLDENGQNTPLVGGVASVVITLLANTEPTGETGAGTYTGTLDDNNVNMTVDFGFKAPSASCPKLLCVPVTLVRN
jgi:SdrD B-like domain/Putative Ig domain